MTQRQAFAERIGVPHGQVNVLMTYVKGAYKAQEKEMNGEEGWGTDSSLPYTNRVEEYAKKLGFGVMWPGMYPILLKDGQQIHLPE